jgi:hypothetical protein
MDAAADALRMTMSDIASLAQVQRPVVSMWRKRSAGSDSPFPLPVAVERGLEIFDAVHIARWLEATGRGNNPEAAEDVAAFARMPSPVAGQQPGGRPNFDGLTSLLTLKVMTGSTLGRLDSHELMDIADECDPDDLFLYSELAALGPALASMADFADRLADSAYNPAEAFERLLADRFRSGLKEHAATALTGSAIDLVASAAVELASTLGTDAVFVDSTSSSDLLLGVIQEFGDSGHINVLTANDDGGAARLVRRRLRVHGVQEARVVEEDGDGFTVQGAAVHVAQYPSPGEPGMDTARILSAVERIILQMDDDQRAVIIAPARVLSDAPLPPLATELRSGLLRSGRVRAIVRLPQGLLRSKPREAQALWVLGPSFADVEIADKWTMVADLFTSRLTEDVVQDLISDIAASMGDLPTVRAHSFRFARLVRTRQLLAGRGSLVALRPPSSANNPDELRSGDADALVRIEDLVRLIGAERPSSPTPAVAVLPVERNSALQPGTVKELLAAGQLSYVKGNRMKAGNFTVASGLKVVGPAEVIEPHAEPPQHISLLHFAARCPSGRLTEPGDVVFCTSPRPAARVDGEGGAVVVFPARVLRIDAGDPGGLVPDVVAADINKLAPADKDWRKWQLRRTSDAQRRPLQNALAELQHEQQEARLRLEQLEELATLITDGVAGGSLNLTDPISNHAAAPTEGTS